MKNKSGFTMLEAMCVLGVICICIAMSYPSLSMCLSRYKMSGAVFQIITDLSSIRFHAINTKVCSRIKFKDGNVYLLQEKKEDGSWNTIAKKDVSFDIETTEPVVEFNSIGVCVCEDVDDLGMVNQIKVIDGTEERIVGVNRVGRIRKL